jgi:hypothetical protein
LLTFLPTVNYLCALWALLPNCADSTTIFAAKTPLTSVLTNLHARYAWVAAWYFLLAFQMTYGKVLVKDYTLSNWGQVSMNMIMSAAYLR